MAYNKSEVEAVADAVMNAIKAVKDGIGVDDTAAAIALFTAFAAAADEFKNDTDAAVLHLGGRLMTSYGDTRVNPEAPA